MDNKQQPAPATTAPAAPAGNANAMAITALVTGIVGICLAWIPFINFVSFILAIIAIVFGAIGVHKKAGGKAIAGLVLGVISLLFVIYMYWAAGNAAKNVVNDWNSTLKNSTIKIDSDGSYTVNYGN